MSQEMQLSQLCGVRWTPYKRHGEDGPALKVIDFDDDVEWSTFMSRVPSPDIPPESDDVVLTASNPTLAPFEANLTSDEATPIELDICLPQSPPTKEAEGIVDILSSSSDPQVRCKIEGPAWASPNSSEAPNDEVEQFESPSIQDTLPDIFRISHPRATSTPRQRTIQLPLDIKRDSSRWIDASIRKSAQPVKRLRQGKLQFEAKKR